MSESDAPKAAKAVATPPTRHIYAREWLEICNMAREGVPVAKIAKSYKVAPSSIYRGLKKRGVMIGAYSKSADELEGDKDRKELVERIKRARDTAYRYTEYLEQQVMKVQTDAAKTGQKPREVLNDMKSLKLAMDTIRLGTDNKWRILGLDADNAEADKVLPELPIRVMTPDEVAAIRDRQNLDDMDIEDAELDDEEFSDEIVEGEDDEGLVEEADPS